MVTIPVIIHAGFEGKLDKPSIRERMRHNPDGVIFEVLHTGQRITGHHALSWDWTLEVLEVDQATVTRTVCLIDFDADQTQFNKPLVAVVR
jgi:hypothetical protein